jgi:4-hydroxy-tetrahydrodipicolinate synthase
MLSIQGVLAAAVTPSRPDAYEMDLGAALEVIDFLSEHPIRGIALFGATGEFPHFTTEDRIRLANMAIKRSRVPVVVNATHSVFDEAEHIAEEAAASGAIAVLLQPPHYFRYGAGEIRECYLDFAQELGKQIPLLLYNLPAFNNPVPVEVALELLAAGLAAGIKDSSGDWEYFSRLLELRRKQPFTLLVGNDILYTKGRIAGADGGISGCACAVPELLTALDEAIAAGNDARMVRFCCRLDEFLKWVDAFPGPYGIREALVVRGLKMGVRAIPLSPETERRAAEFREWFQGWLPAVQVEIREA